MLNMRLAPSTVKLGQLLFEIRLPSFFEQPHLSISTRCCFADASVLRADKSILHLSSVWMKSKEDVAGQFLHISVACYAVVVPKRRKAISLDVFDSKDASCDCQT
eukprot:IDg1442t1